jgi:hypothetical protein
MRMVSDRAVLTVTRLENAWCVDHDGQQFGHSPDKEVAKAAANREARAIMDSGRPCQVRVLGEHGFWGA